MATQIKRNAELKKLEASSLPPGGVDAKGNPLPQTGQIVPNINEANTVG